MNRHSKGEFIRLHMPNSGEDGVIVATANDGRVVEFRGRPYSQWEIGEFSPMFLLHSVLKRVNVSELHNGEVETVTPWHPEWSEVKSQFERALLASD